MARTGQSGLQRRGMFYGGPQANGLLLRGVVMATYVLDDPNHPSTVATGDDGKDPVGVYCDVLIYSNVPGMQCYAMPNVLVLQDRGNMHSGRVWKPKATTIDITGPLDPDTGSQVSNMDGDHVLIGFLDNQLNRPIILGGIPHPSHDIGVPPDTFAGRRRQLVLADGDPDFIKHHGSVFGVEDNGDWLLDTTFANDGSVETDGSEPAPPTDGKGSQGYHLPQDAEHRVEFWDMADPTAPVSTSYQSLTKAALDLQLNNGATLKAEGKDGTGKLTVGDGAKSAIIAEAWETFFDTTLKTWLTTHTHPTGVGPSGPPTEAPGFPAYSSAAATSTKLKFPDA